MFDYYFDQSVKSYTDLAWSERHPTADGITDIYTVLQPFRKEMATHSSILAWRIPWTAELGGLQSMGRKESDTNERLHCHFQPFIRCDFQIYK